MPADATVLRLAERLVARGLHLQFGKLRVTVVTEYDVDVRQGKITGWTMVDQPRVTAADVSEHKGDLVG